MHPIHGQNEIIRTEEDNDHLGLFHQQILLLTIHSSPSRLVFMEIKSVLPAPMLSELFKKVLAS